MLVYVIRHGETDWNRIGRLQGRKDVALNATGQRQAAENGARLARHLGRHADRFDYVSSPLGRARETMERLRAAMRLEPSLYRLDQRLVELSFGAWEGRTLAEVAEDDLTRVRARQANKWDFQPPGDDAESYEILSWRVGAWLRAVSENTVCVSHGGIIRCLFHLVEGVPGDEAAAINVPQDKILELSQDGLRWL